MYALLDRPSTIAARALLRSDLNSSANGPHERIIFRSPVFSRLGAAAKAGGASVRIYKTGAPGENAEKKRIYIYNMIRHYIGIWYIIW